jgi:hypothetical protein
MGEGHDDRLRALEAARTDVGVVVDIIDPVACPGGHRGVITIQLIEEISAASPEIRHPIGGGYFCPTCGESFYQVGNHSWKPKSDVPTDVAPAAAPPGPAPVRRASPRFR